VTIDDVLSSGHDATHMSSDDAPAAGETIGQRLKRLRQERGLSQRELAAPGVSYAYISRIEAGTRQPSVKALRRLAANLGVSADYLETGSELGDAERRELRLADLELAVRLGEARDVETPLFGLLDEANAAGDREAARRASVCLATVAINRSEWDLAARLLETSVAGEAFAPADRYDIYAALGYAYSHGGRPHAAVALYERCLEAVSDLGHASLEARYASLLSYALSDMGDVARAEEVVQRALVRLDDEDDPYMRVRLYWSVARLAHGEGRESVALTNIRKAIALLQATEDTIHLARAHILAAGISRQRDPADAERHLDAAEQLLGGQPAVADAVEIAIQRAEIATDRGDAAAAAAFARRALEVNAGANPVDDGLAYAALGNALALQGDEEAADDAYGRAARILERRGRWHDAANACRAWARMLRQVGREDQAMDVLDRAAELAMRATPADARVEH
jgi:transcriptional regulator with XRE-family HTH domain